jgi:hypothetical protein
MHGGIYGEPTASWKVNAKRRWPHGFCFGDLQTVLR